MGAVYRPRYKAADGTPRESAVWWVRFRQHGKTVRQSTGTTSHPEAVIVLKQQEGKVALKIPVNVEADRLALKDGVELIRADYRANGRSSLTQPGAAARPPPWPSRGDHPAESAFHGHHRAVQDNPGSRRARRRQA
jgi:hypothetical protein